MIVDLPDTTTSAVSKALVKIREEGGAVALGRVLTLVIATPLGEEEEAIEAANDASREHPMRVIVLSRSVRGRDTEEARLDGQIRVGGDAGASEVIVLRAYGDTASDEEGLVTSLLLPDAPVVVWWPRNPPIKPSASPLGKIAHRRITDAAEAPNPITAIMSLGTHYAPGDTDFAWTRLTLWRAQLAAVLDQPPYEPVTAVRVTGSVDSPSSELLAAWLRLQLEVPVTLVTTNPHQSSGIHGVRLTRKSGAIELERQLPSIATLVQPNQPTHDISLPRRNLRDCLAEELRRLDPDDLFGEVLQRGLPLLEARVAAPRKACSSRERGTEEGEFVTNERRVLVHPDKQNLAGSVAARFITKIIDVLDDLGEANVVLTGGTMGEAVLKAIADSPARDSVDWSRITFWWGDERYLPDGDPDRNDTQSRAALLDALNLREDQVKSFPSPGDQSDIWAAADAYQAELADAARDGSRYPRFDITFLGVGPDGHIASLFPDHEAVRETHRVVIAETHSPKPPPERLSLTLPVLNSSDRIWLVLAGADKASALGLALAGASADEVPVAGVEGRRRTVFFIDQEAAAEVPESLIAPEYYWTATDE